MGSGWLGLPLAEHFALMGHHVKASTTSENRLSELAAARVEPFIIDIGRFPVNFQAFLQTDVLIINIPSTDINAFKVLAREIENSELKKVLFVSSTSVYANSNKTISESDGEESPHSPLFRIENLLKNSDEIKTTIVRFGGLIGYSRHPGMFFKKGRLVQNPDANVNLIHRDDCIQIISRIVEEDVWGEDLNCCADTHPTKREFYTHAAKSIGLPAPEFAELDGNSFKIIDNQKVKQVLNYRFFHPDLMRTEWNYSVK